MIPATITTERLSLAALATGDHSFIQELLNTAGWLQFIGDRNVRSKDDALQYINRINSTPNIRYWVVRITDTSEPVGLITLIKRAYLDHSDIGFAFLPQYHGKGYAYEAAKKILDTVSRLSEHQTVLATTLAHNSNSIKLLTRLGLQFDREIEADGEKLHVYAISAERPGTT